MKKFKIEYRPCYGSDKIGKISKRSEKLYNEPIAHPKINSIEDQKGKYIDNLTYSRVHNPRFIDKNNRRI